MFQNITCFGQGTAAINPKPIVFCQVVNYHLLTCSFSNIILVLCGLSFSQRFSWRTSEWKACQVSLFDQQSPQHHKHAVLCGGGIQTREVYCVQITVEGETHRLKEGMCLESCPSQIDLSKRRKRNPYCTVIRKLG